MLAVIQRWFKVYGERCKHCANLCEELVHTSTSASEAEPRVSPPSKDKCVQEPDSATITKTLHRKTFLKDWLHFVSLKASMCKSHLRFWRPWKPLGSTEGWATFFLNFKNKHQLNPHSTFLILIQRTTVQAAAYTSHTECRFELWFLGVWTSFMIPCLGRQLRSLSSMWETQVKPGSSLSLA